MSLVPEAAARKALLKQVSAIASAGGPLTPAAAPARLSQVLAAPIEKSAAHATPGRGAPASPLPPRCCTPMRWRAIPPSYCPKPRGDLP